MDHVESAERARRAALAGCLARRLGGLLEERARTLLEVEDRVRRLLATGLCRIAQELAYSGDSNEYTDGVLRVKAELGRVEVRYGSEVVLDCDADASPDDVKGPFAAMALVRVYKPGKWEQRLLEAYVEVVGVDRADVVARDLEGFLERLRSRYGLGKP